MSARGKNSQKGKNVGASKVANVQAPVAAPTIIEKKGDLVVPAQTVKQDVSNKLKTMFSHDERAKFYTGHERLDLQAAQVQRVRELQEENDHLQREINAREIEIHETKDPLVILADIEHRKTIIARNTGEILNIYTRNEERLKKMNELEKHNDLIKNEMKSKQGRFVNTLSMDEKTQIASDFFILRSTIEKNLQEIKDLSKN